MPRILQKVKNIVNRWVMCKKFEGHPYIYAESPALLECRIVPSHCFSNIGIYYADPVFIKNGFQLKIKGGMRKVWIVLDNGSNFISREVQNYASIKWIKWSFNLPKTP